MELYETIKIDPLSRVAIYKQLVYGLERFCLENPPNTPIPPEREMSQYFGISRTILRQALKIARERGILIQKWGKGIYTCDKKQLSRILVFFQGISESAHPWHYLLPGIEERCTELSITLEKVDLRFMRSQSCEEILSFLKKEAFRGIIHLDYMDWPEAPEYLAMLKAECPVIYPHVHESWGKTIPFASMWVNERLEFERAVLALLEHGFSRIMTVFIKKDDIRDHTQAEYLTFLREHGASDSSEYLYFDEDQMNSLPARIRACRIPPDAILCFSDFQAIEVYRVFKKEGFRIPEDFSVMGFCGYPGGAFMTPPLSTIDFQYHEMGRRAVDRLLKLPADYHRITDSEKMESQLCMLQLRKSVLSPKKALSKNKKNNKG